jgi:hypothetical protein
MTSLICAATLWINLTNFEWNTHDKKIYNRAKSVCVFKYKSNPCIKKFIKSDKRTYRVICGAKSVKSFR